MALAQALLPEFEHETATLRRVIERIPADRLDYRPHPKSFTLGDLANHLVSIPGWTVSTLTETELDFGLPEAQARQPKPSSTTEGLLRTLDAQVEAALGALTKTSDEDFHVVLVRAPQGSLHLGVQAAGGGPRSCCWAWAGGPGPRAGRK